jgi:radical SAM superfamily enzyme YgiQ (UPF0313 family)
METEDLLVILKFLKEMFPRISRMTSYARTKTLARKTVEELTALHGAGLSRIHVGFETGYDPLLTYIRKGVTSREEEEAGKKVISSGISLCVYVMPGLGGQKWTLEHAVESARVLNQINPHHIRLRTLHVQPSMGIYEKIQSGEMKLLDEDDVVREIRVFVAHLEGVQSYIVSDHILNLLEEIEGRLPQDREKLLGIIDRYLSLPEAERLIFKFGRRAGVYRSLDELQEVEPHQRIERAIGRLGEMEPQKIEMTLRSMMDNFI